MQKNKSILHKIAAYGVHAFTALGAVSGLWALLLIYQGQTRGAIWVLFAAVIIDAVDGTLARAVRTKKYAPTYNGALMDNIIDFVTWTVAPLFWFYAVSTVPVWPLLICVLASIFGFTHIEAKTSDDFFTGFPSYWNFVVFYLYLLSFSVPLTIAILLFFAVATFLPIRFVYPSRTIHFRTLTNILGVICLLQFVGLIIMLKASPAWLVYSSFIFPAYYMILSFYLHVKHPRQ